jgi:hypothetical protein
LDIIRLKPVLLIVLVIFFAIATRSSRAQTPDPNKDHPLEFRNNVYQSGRCSHHHRQSSATGSPRSRSWNAAAATK